MNEILKPVPGDSQGEDGQDREGEKKYKHPDILYTSNGPTRARSRSRQMIKSILIGLHYIIHYKQFPSFSKYTSSSILLPSSL